ncbi:MAG: DNA polymerase III subunit delta, partial [Bacteroidota bacterium]
MEFTSHKQILQGIEQRQFFPVYILHGEESYFVDVLTTAIEQNVLSDGEKAFNQMVFYGVDAHPEQIVDFARQFPMMSERKVVILKEAKGMNDCRLNQLSDYISNPAPHTILVLSHPDKAINGNLTLLKSAKISKHVATF